MSQLRFLVLAPASNPELLTTPQIAYAHAEALARIHSVTLVVLAAAEPAICRARGNFKDTHAVRLPGLDELNSWALRRIFKYVARVLPRPPTAVHRTLIDDSAYPRR